jgi:hypothetical protein
VRQRVRRVRLPALPREDAGKKRKMSSSMVESAAESAECRASERPAVIVSK